MLLIAVISQKTLNAKVTTPTKHSEYKCTRCGKTKSDAKGSFFMSKTSPLFVANELYSHICSDCANQLFLDAQAKHKDTRMALIIVCHYLDTYFNEALYESIKDNANFSLGNYLKMLNAGQYKTKNFTSSLVSIIKDGLKTAMEIQEVKEAKWTKEEISNKEEAISIVGYDPFEGHPENDRRFLFGELFKYFDDEIIEDNYKLSQIIQIVNNNNQIRQYDLIISSLNAVKDAADIKILNGLKKELVNSNDKMARENEVSLKNRTNKDLGKSTLTYLMKDLREKDLKKAEANYYDQLMSDGTLWAINMSNKSLQQNGLFDENDKQEIFDIQRNLIQDLQKKLDIELEKNRLLLVENIDLKSKIDGDKNE